MQYLLSEIIELSGNEAERAKKQRIAPLHVMLVIRRDQELNTLLGKGADFTSESGHVKNIPKSALPFGKKSKGKGKVAGDEGDDETCLSEVSRPHSPVESELKVRDMCRKRLSYLCHFSHVLDSLFQIALESSLLPISVQMTFILSSK